MGTASSKKGEAEASDAGRSVFAAATVGAEGTPRCRVLDESVVLHHLWPGLEGDDVRGAWYLKPGFTWNVRDQPSGTVVGTVQPGSEIEVSEHLGSDWVRICAPADLAGSCVRLRSRQSPRAWAGPTRA